MKRFNKNSLLFIFFLLFVILGVAGSCIREIAGETRSMLAAACKGDLHGVMEHKEQIDSVSSKSLNYHDSMLDLNGAKENLLGTRVIYKEDTTVVKTDSGSLTVPVHKAEHADIVQAVAEISKLNQICEENGAKFLYFAAPTKQLLEELPANVENYAKENYMNFFAEMDRNGIAYLDYTQSLSDSSFYYTDHHWTIRTGFAATTALCEALNAVYGFTYNADYTSLENYNITLYEDYFLGSYGKKAGTNFSEHGADDFELITPKFSTRLTETQPFKDTTRTGTFENTVLYMDNMKKDYYSANPYAVYSGGDFRLQIMKNELNTTGEKVLLIRDSYACAVAPFLALHTSELHICDVRNFSYFSGEKINVESYIEEIQPDYVIVLYTGVTSIEESSGRFDFF